MGTVLIVKNGAAHGNRPHCHTVTGVDISQSMKFGMKILSYLVNQKMLCTVFCIVKAHLPD